MAQPRIVVADDHPLFRDALRHALTQGKPGIEIHEAGSLGDLEKLLQQDDNFDLVLLDLRMPGVQGLSGLMFLRSSYPNLPVAIISASDQPDIVRTALSLGASGFISKSSNTADIMEAVETVLAGGVWSPAEAGHAAAPVDDELAAISRRVASLTAQQIRVLMMLKEGLLNKQIAYELGVSEATVKAHVSAILSKLAVSSRTQAVIAAGKLEGQTATS
jgi:DNA-binding NarL/FixJ family response regulator